MGFFSEIVESTGLGQVVGSSTDGDVFKDAFSNLGVGQLLGIGAGDAEKRAAAAQEALAREAIATELEQRGIAQSFLEPFSQVGSIGLDQASFLTDPQQQFDYLQNNPLFDLALENTNRATLQGAAAGGRLAAGDTLTDLSNNVLLSAQPLINQQASNISGLLDFGLGTAQTQGNIAIGQGTNVGNLLQNIGDIQAAGTIASDNARTAGTQNIINTLGILGGFGGG